jgi:CheY-like chemotaxis protein
MTPSRPHPLRVLVVADDEDVRRAIRHVVDEDGDVLVTASSVEEAVALVSANPIDVAFVELRVEGGAALALCHHLTSLSPSTRVQIVLHPTELERGPEALSLGASGVLVAPPTGEAIARVLDDVKADFVRRNEVTSLEAKLSRERRRLETYDRLVRFARSAAPSDAVRAIVDGVAQLSSAQGVALYATFGDEDSERVLLASIGTARDLPSSCAPAELTRVVQARAARVVPLVAATGAIGLLILDRVPATVEPDVARLADLAAAMLSIVDRPDPVDDNLKVFPPTQFRTVADRLLTLAQRHDRRSSVLAISIPGERPGRKEDTTREIADIVRTTDALCGVEDGDLILLLPETGGLGAHVCRRRILARLVAAREQKSGASSHQDAKSRLGPVAIGVATFPHDGATVRRLIKAARSRAVLDARSPIHALSLEGASLREIVDALLARPMFDVGPRSTYPLHLPSAALFSLAASACKEAQRGGETNVTATLQPGLGLAAAARQTSKPRVFDVRAEHGCENIEAIVVEAEHSAWVCCGRIVGGRFQGVHAADPLLADAVARQISVSGAPDVE